MHVQLKMAVTMLLLIATFSFNQTHAQYDNLVINGEFEDPQINGSAFVNANLINGWSTTDTSNQIELWEQGFSGSPPNGTDALGTGQHCELTPTQSGSIISQTVTIPANVSGNARFSFDCWSRPGHGNPGPDNVEYELEGDQSGVIASGSFTAPESSWDNLLLPCLTVVPGENVEIRFTFNVSGAGGPHIDQVVFEVKCATFEPENVLCELDAAGNFTGNYIVTGPFTNLQDIPGAHVLLPPNAVSPAGVNLCFGNGTQTVDLVPVLNNGDSIDLGGNSNDDALVIKNADPGDEVCFRLVLLSDGGEVCCSVEVCIVMPPCDCFQIDRRFDEITDVLCIIDGTTTPIVCFNYTFQLTNLFGQDIYHLFLTSNDQDVTFTPDYIDVFALNGNAPLGHGQSILFTVKVTAQNKQPGDNIDFLITVHNDDFSECCSRPHCIEVPECPPGAIMILGDMDESGHVNLLDVEPFIDILQDGQFNEKADINLDGVVNLLDIDGFIGLISG